MIYRRQTARKARRFNIACALKHTSQRFTNIAATALLRYSASAPRYSDVMKQDVLKQATLQVVQSVTAALAAAVAGATGVAESAQTSSMLALPTLAILLEWWAANPAYST